MKWKETADLTKVYLEENTSMNIEERTNTEQLYWYYKYEEADCWYAFNLKELEYTKAIEFAKKAKEFMKKAIDVIDSNLHNISDDFKGELLTHKANWEYCLYTVRIKELEPNAKKANIEGNHLGALDIYKKILRVYEKAISQYEDSDLQLDVLRTLEGNHFGMAANTSVVRVNYLKNRPKDVYDELNLDIELIESFLLSYEFGMKAFHANPEQYRYKKGSLDIKENIKILLISLKDNWGDLLIAFSDNEIFCKLLKSIDHGYYTLLKEHYIKKKTHTKIRDLVISNTYVLETNLDADTESEECAQGTCFHLKGVGLVTCEHCLVGKVEVFETKKFHKKLPIKLKNKNPVVDLALLEIPTGLSSNEGLDIADSEKLLAANELGGLLYIVGFPNYKNGNEIIVKPCVITGYRPKSSVKRIVVSSPIIGGTSGGPVLDVHGRVVGVAVTGADMAEKGKDTEHSTIIPIHMITKI